MGYHRIPGIVEFVNPALLFRIRNGVSGLVRAELPDKSVINDVGAAGMGRSDVKNRIGAFRPFGVRFAVLEKKTFGFGMADFGQGKGNLKQPVMNPAHGHVEPVLGKRGSSPFDTLDDFLAADPDMADVGSNPGFSLQGNIQAE